MLMLHFLANNWPATEASESTAVQQTNGEGTAEQKGEEGLNGHADSTFGFKSHQVGGSG